MNEKLDMDIPSLEDLLRTAEEEFREKFGEYPTVRACAPGRVNLIGEHIDYNDGLVLPMCIPLMTVVVGGRSMNPHCAVITLSDNIPKADKRVEFLPRIFTEDVDTSGPKWSHYIKGVIAYYRGKCEMFNAAIISSVPLGGGLSSSASLEVAFLTFLEALHPKHPRVSLRDKALLCQEAEHVYAKMPCGIMDQFASVMGKKNHLVQIDCKSMDVRLVELRSPVVKILITNSNVNHELSSSEYPKRRRECETVLRFLNIPSFREVTLEDLNRVKEDMDEVLYRRARHVITEIARVKETVVSLEGCDNVRVGRLMTESHYSLRDDYEVSCPELDELVEIANSVGGVYGSRMTGGGFGGCTVTLVKTTVLDSLMKKIKESYSGTPTFYVCNPEDGARILSEYQEISLNKPQN